MIRLFDSLLLLLLVSKKAGAAALLVGLFDVAEFGHGISLDSYLHPLGAFDHLTYVPATAPGLGRAVG